MSTGFECFFQEVEPDVWYYVLQDWDCPVGAWDWREYAIAYGPFATQEAAQRHLSDNHANPGGWSVEPYDANRRLDTVMQELVKHAERPRPRSRLYW